jgi:hypothetical protein
MHEPEEMGDAVDQALVEVVCEELLELYGRVLELEQVAEALNGEWEDDDAS